MSGEQSTRRGPLTGRVLYADGTDDRFDQLTSLVEQADGRITRELEPDLFAIVTDDVRDDELVDHALECGSAVLTPENAIAQIEARLARAQRAAERRRKAAAEPSEIDGDGQAESNEPDESNDESADKTAGTAHEHDTGHETDDADVDEDDRASSVPRVPIHRRIDWEKLAAAGAIVIIAVFAVNVWNERSEERARYEANVELQATENRTAARCTVLADGEQGEVLVFNELLAASSDGDGTFWSDVVDELVVLCESS